MMRILYYSVLLGCAELLGGTTSIIDMGTVNHTAMIFQAVEQAGALPDGKCLMDSGGCTADRRAAGCYR